MFLQYHLFVSIYPKCSCQTLQHYHLFHPYCHKCNSHYCFIRNYVLCIIYLYTLYLPFILHYFNYTIDNNVFNFVRILPSVYNVDIQIWNLIYANCCCCRLIIIITYITSVQYPIQFNEPLINKYYQTLFSNVLHRWIVVQLTQLGRLQTISSLSNPPRLCDNDSWYTLT